MVNVYGLDMEIHYRLYPESTCPIKEEVVIEFLTY